MKAFLDTHAALALHDGLRDRFGPASLDLMERAALFVSPFVRFELYLLHEIGRVAEPGPVLAALADYEGVVESAEKLGEVVSAARDLTWTRDPFDRALVATAALHRAPLITRDGVIHQHFEGAVW